MSVSIETDSEDLKKRRRKFKGTYYRLVNDVLKNVNLDDPALNELIYELCYHGATSNELYYSAMLYDSFFIIEEASIEFIGEICGFLDFGMKQEFWLSYYQAADLAQKLRHEKIRSSWAEDKPIDHLLRQARDKFLKVPMIVSSVTLFDIGMRIMERFSGKP
jgi:hypothetical protein